MEYTNCIFRIISNQKCISERVLECVNGRALELADLFGLHNLPYEYRICIHLCGYEKFNLLTEKCGIRNQYKNCLAFSSDAVYAIEYNDITAEISEVEYSKIILHECIHILQQISTKLAPAKVVWLYESIACFLSDQETVKPIQLPSWNDLRNDFYSIRECYSFAYIFGKFLINTIGLEKIISMQDNLEELEQMGYNAYCRLQQLYPHY